MRNKYLKEFLDGLNNPPKDIGKYIKEEFSGIRYKSYGTPELEMKLLHSLFLQIKAEHPGFESFGWEQCNSYNDNYYHFQLFSLTVNEKLDIETDIDFYFPHHEDDKITSDILFNHIEYPDPDEIEFARTNNLEYDNDGVRNLNYKDFMNFMKEKYHHLETPTLKFMVILKLLEIHFGMYYFLYTFGNGVKITIKTEGVTITQLEINEIDGGAPLVADLDEL